MPKDDPKIQSYLDLARQMGAVDVMALATDQIAFDPRTILKCMFGCGDWGHAHTCPSRPGSPGIFEYERILRRYSYGILVHSHEKRLNQEISYEIERRAYLDGYPFAFSLSDCGLCEECAGLRGEPCINPKKARPAFHSVGIDVFTTAKRLGLPLAPLKDENQEQNWYAFVFIE